MKGRRLRAVATILFGLSSGAFAGEVACLGGAGRIGCAERALPHIAYKAVVLEFLDPGDTGYGEAASRLLWRETLTAIRDMRGRGVVLATRSGDNAAQQADWERLLARFGADPADVLRGTFHDGALRVGETLGGQMVAWGGVVGNGSRVALYSYVSAIPEIWLPLLKISLRRSSEASSPPLATLPIELRRLAFAPVIAEPSVLFGAAVSARCNLRAGCPNGVPIRSEAAEEASLPSGLREGIPLRVIDARGKWLQVSLPDSRRVWINIYHTDLGPIEVTIPSGGSAILRTDPARTQGTRVRDQTIYRVEEVRRVANILWYRIISGERRGWVKEDEVEPRHRLAAVHFLAGLYRFGAGQFQRAEREFNAFLQREGQRGDPVTHSAALQLIALARLRQNSRASPVSDAEEALAEALRLTPFDPAIYSMRAAIRLAQETHSLPAALDDLSQALNLFPDHPAARSFASSLIATAIERPAALRAVGLNPDEILAAANSFPPLGSLPR